MAEVKQSSQNDMGNREALRERALKIKYAFPAQNRLYCSWALSTYSLNEQTCLLNSHL